MYLVFILAILFPIHGGLVVSEPTHPTLYTLVYIFVSGYLLFALTGVMIYMIEQAYIFKVETIFIFLRDVPYYTDVVRNSWLYSYIMSHQNTLVPL